MSDRLIRLVAKAIGDVDGVNASTYEHLAKAAVAVIDREFDGFRRENDRLRDLMSLQNTEIEKLRKEKAHANYCCDDLRITFHAEVEKLRTALQPFADVADNDICDSLTDDDIFRPITPEYSRAAVLCVGDLRAAAAAYRETVDE